MSPSVPPVTIKRTPEPVSVTQRAAVRMTLNVLIAIMLLVNGYLAYGHLSARKEGEEKRAVEAAALKSKPIQLNVLNGCGEPGIAARCTEFLRSKGFDVVEMKNFPVTGLPRTIVVDRIGKPDAAGYVARAVGLDETSVVQQVNPNLFVDVTIILGNDYSSLLPFTQ